MRIINLTYFFRDLLVFIITTSATIIIIALRKNAREAMKYKPFSMASIFGLLSFLLISLAELIGMLINTAVLINQYETWQFFRSIIFTMAAFFLLASVLSFYVPFGKKRYVIFKVVSEAKLSKLWGAYYCDRNSCYAVFKALLNARLPGIAIARDPPEIFREKLGLHLTPVIWISKIKHEDAVSPTRLEFLIQRLADFLKSVDIDKVILIDCLDYLILENGEKAVSKFITKLKDLSILHRGITLVTLDEEVLPDNMIHFLKSELEPVSNLNINEIELLNNPQN
ncbi:DUF835 domain-containing protein [Pyrococcus horikoshii]|uniref:DUF835 domain-containing protein n=2 Tax=Pyrococcus horikoshii TaxID=53953 RepID=O57787_PYRHO|nr:DUF835 domain-containing protein [Pyrococcus horikoshii]BAA29145.1 282aa long hypothetical protein [Pyrococcus horikoshii OT3]HII61563.1 DUF835 domain-containing protein [Pyrococcus horikoshii]